MTRDEALRLFKRLGVDASVPGPRFTAAYFALARRYHPDRNPAAAELMANINAARTALRAPNQSGPDQ